MDYLSNINGLLPFQVDHTEHLLNVIRKHGTALDASDMGTGKCLGRGTPILMFDGRVMPVQDIKVGDALMGDDSTPRHVLSVTSGIDDLYRITPVKGDSWVCNSSHILSVRSGCTTRRYGGIEKGHCLDIPVRDWLAAPANFKAVYKMYRAPVDFPEAPVEFDPYIYGCWLADGLRREPMITKCDGKLADHIEAYFQGLGYRIVRVPRPENNTVLRFFRAASATNPFRKFVAGSTCAEGLKFIRREYLANCRQVRFGLLAGILDCDGYVDRGGFEIAQKSPQLARDICYLARSLGFAAYVADKYVNGARYYRITISGDCSLIPTRFKIAPARRQKKNVLHTGFRVEPVGRGDYYGFVLDGNRRFLLGDFTVTHNTYVSTALVREIGLPTLVVAPKSSLTKWERVGDLMGGEVTAINYERLARCRNPFGQFYTERGVERWRWSDAVRFVIFDECHRCGGTTTLNHRLMVANRHQNIPGIALSATAAENPTRMKALGYFLKLFDGGIVERAVKTPQGVVMRKFMSKAVSGPHRDWAMRYGCHDGWQGWGYYGKPEDMVRLHKTIFPERGARLRIADIPDFPDTQITAELIDLDTHRDIQAVYRDVEPEIRALRARTAEWNPQDKMLQKLLERQEIDLLKVPTYITLIQDALEEGRSVALFVPYRATVDAVGERLAALGINASRIWGGQSAGERQEQIDMFQRDAYRVAIIVNQAGGESIDLHDIRGRFPRLALITPPYEAWLLRQIVGRVRRAGGKSKSIQRILCAAGTYEEHIFSRLLEKEMNMDALNDGDLNPFQYAA